MQHMHRHRRRAHHQRLIPEPFSTTHRAPTTHLATSLWVRQVASAIGPRREGERGHSAASDNTDTGRPRAGRRQGGVGGDQHGRDGKYIIRRGAEATNTHDHGEYIFEEGSEATNTAAMVRRRRPIAGPKRRQLVTRGTWLVVTVQPASHSVMLALACSPF
jgi:hypothetical protein